MKKKNCSTCTSEVALRLLVGQYSSWYIPRRAVGIYHVGPQNRLPPPHIVLLCCCCTLSRDYMPRYTNSVCEYADYLNNTRSAPTHTDTSAFCARGHCVPRYSAHVRRTVIGVSLVVVPSQVFTYCRVPSPPLRRTPLRRRGRTSRPVGLEPDGNVVAPCGGGESTPP